MIAVGILLGAVVAIFVGRALENYLFDVRPSDPLSLVIAAGCSARSRWSPASSRRPVPRGPTC